ncbi:RNA-directed DNA polymerase, eukaryota, reverse transcriptase zinc-binding domain protein [Tanacetum coccineum]|uniref:RNA-directed DNA polymerase, eukaryota, reverse transcriptase zinc-binding domain protein n=1 Tax=Tanacetum coccineum TaxID=301880 RepID=A0ABQ5DVQ5_9ASTR
MHYLSSWNILIDKFKSRLSKWKASLLSIGGRFTLIKYVLGSLGIYYLSIFKAPESIIRIFEKARAKFLWGGSHGNNKMAWVRWDNVLASHDQGGLGIGSLKAFNLVLLQKWRWRLVTKPDLLWVKLIKSIHGPEAGFDGKGYSSSGVWPSIVGTSNYLHSHNILPKDSLKCHLGNGTTIRFWKDLWLGDEPLYSRYNRLFRLDINENYLLSERYNEGRWNWQWLRPIAPSRAEAMLQSLLTNLAEVTLYSSPDQWKWLIGNDGTFSIASTRTHLDHLMLPSLATSTTWIPCLPRKVNIFLWRFNLDRLPHRLNLSKHGIDIDSILCLICNNHVESASHPPAFTDWLSWVDNIEASQVKKEPYLCHHCFYVLDRLEVP